MRHLSPRVWRVRAASVVYSGHSVLAWFGIYMELPPRLCSLVSSLLTISVARLQEIVDTAPTLLLGPLHAVWHDVVVVQIREVRVVEGVRAPVRWTPVAQDCTLHLSLRAVQVTWVSLHRCDL